MSRILLVLSVGIISVIVSLVLPKIVSAHSGICPIYNSDNHFGSGDHLCGCNYVSTTGVQEPMYDSCTCSINHVGHAYPCPPLSCNATISCSTCNTTNTTRTTCVYTTYTGGGSCTQVTAPHQACSTGLTCSAGSCVDSTKPVGSLNINSGATSSTSKVVTLNLSATDGVGVTGYSLSENSTPSSLNFDGTDDYVSVPDSSSLQLGTQQTVEAWVKWNGSGATDSRIVGKGDSGNRNYGLWIYQTLAGRWLFQIGDAGATVHCSAAPGSVMPNTAWNHLVGTYDRATIKLYLNGVQVASSACTVTPAVGAYPLTIGWANAGTGAPIYSPFNGQIDEVKIYNRALTLAEIQDSYAQKPVSTVGLVGFYNFNEGTGTTAANSGSGGSVINGTLSNFASPPTATSGWTPGGPFTAITSTISFSADFLYTFLSDGAKTVYAWYKDAANNISTVASKSITIITQPQAFTITTTNLDSTAKGCWNAGKPYIDLSWQASAGADQYWIYRALPSQTYSLIATGITATTYRDPTPNTRINPPDPNTTYSYKVTARNNSSANTLDSQPVEIKTFWCDYEKPTAAIENIVDTCYSPTSWTNSKTIQASAFDQASGVSSVDFKLTNLTTNTLKTFPAVSAGGFWTADIPSLVENNQYKIEVQAKDSADNLVPTDSSAPPNSSGWIGAKAFDFRSSCAGTSTGTTTTTSFVCQKSLTNPNAEGLISAPSVFGKFSNITGQCVIDPNKAPVPTYELPSFTELKNKYYDQSKLSSIDTIVGAPERSGLVAHWTFDDGTAKDSSINNNNGTLTNLRVPLSSTLVIDNGRKALKFGYYDYYLDYANIPDSTSLAVGQTTIEVWVKYNLDSCFLNGSCPIFKRASSTGVGGTSLVFFPVDSNTAYLNFTTYINGSWQGISGTSLHPNIWYHIVGTYDGSVQKIYQGGQLIFSRSISGTINNPLSPTTQIGSATIDDLRIYNRALTAAEIREDYDLGNITGKTFKYTINKATASQNDFDIANNGIYYLAGNLEINSDITNTTKRTIVAFVNGDLNIKSNYTFGDNSNGTVFVVKGKVNIDKAVTRFDGVLISFGEGASDAYTICTASETDGSCPKDIITTSPLTVSGSLISLSTDSNKTIRFRRNLTTNTSPAEIINSQAKYSAILNNLFSSDLKVWSEVQD